MPNNKLILINGNSKSFGQKFIKLSTKIFNHKKSNK